MARGMAETFGSGRIVADMEAALARGNSRFTINDVARALAHGCLRVGAGDRLSGSVWIRHGAEAGPMVEIVHIAGRWDDREARWLYSMADQLAREHGLPLTFSGRPGWARFLRRRGWVVTHLYGETYQLGVAL